MAILLITFFIIFYTCVVHCLRFSFSGCVIYNLFVRSSLDAEYPTALCNFWKKKWIFIAKEFYFFRKKNALVSFQDFGPPKMASSLLNLNWHICPLSNNGLISVWNGLNLTCLCRRLSEHIPKASIWRPLNLISPKNGVSDVIFKPSAQNCCFCAQTARKREEKPLI